MNKLIFKPEMFDRLYKDIMKDGYLSKDAGCMWEPLTEPNEIATLAQAIFDEWLKSATVVYAEGNNQPWHNVSFQGATHKALLVCVEEHKPKCEKHIPMTYYDLRGTRHEDAFPKKAKCTICGVEIEPTGWKAKE